MTNAEKITLLEEMLELDEESITAETKLDDIEEWDSMAALMLINLADLRFKKELVPNQIRNFQTVGDILDFLG